MPHVWAGGSDTVQTPSSWAVQQAAAGESASEKTAVEGESLRTENIVPMAHVKTEGFIQPCEHGPARPPCLLTTQGPGVTGG